MILVVCKCGVEREQFLYNLVYGNTSGCHKCGASAGEDHTLWTGCGEMSGTYWKGLCEGAKTRDLEFTITKEHVWELYLKQGGKCALSGVSLVMKTVKHHHTDRTASLDRIDSTIGYVPENVQWVHKTVNAMKLAMPEDILRSWAAKVTTCQATKKVVCPG